MFSFVRTLSHSKSKQQSVHFYNTVLHFFYCRFSDQDELTLKTEIERPGGNTCIISILQSMELCYLKKKNPLSVIVNFHSKTTIMILFKPRTQLIYILFLTVVVNSALLCRSMGGNVLILIVNRNT